MTSDAIRDIRMPRRGMLCLVMLAALMPRPSHAAGISLMLNTVAGTEADNPTTATIEAPSGIAVDASGSVYFADTESNVVRMVNTTDNTIHTVAGSGVQGYSGDGGLANAASLNEPKDVSVDAAGNIYIADTFNHIVRKVASDGIITTVAGTGTICTLNCAADGSPAVSAGLNLPTSVQFDNTSSTLYIAGDGQNVVWAVAAGGTITRFAGSYTAGYNGEGIASTTARLNSPVGLANSPYGDLYIADRDNDLIRFVNSSAIINRSAGSTTGMPDNYGYAGDGGLATSALLNTPTDVWYSPSGMYFIADLDNHAVRMVNTTDGIISTVAGTGTNGYSGNGGAATSAMLNSPSGVAYDDASGTLYVADTNNNRIRKVVSGVIYPFAGNGFEGFIGDGNLATSAPLFAPVWTAVNAAGTLLYFSDEENHQVRKVDLATGIITTVAGNGTAGYSGDNGPAISAQLKYPAGLALDEATDTLYIADLYNDRVRKVNLATGYIYLVAGNGTYGYWGDGGAATSAELRNPAGLALDAAGDLYIADSFNQVIRKVSGGVITRVAGNINGIAGYTGDGGLAISARLNYPSGLWLQKSANMLYIADEVNHAIRKVNLATGIITTVAGNGTGTSGYSGDGGPATAALLNAPSGVAVTPVGEIIISDTNNHAIRRIDPVKLTISTLIGNGTAGFAGDSDPSSARLYLPRGVAVAQSADPKAALYIADASNHRVRELKITNRPPYTPALTYPAQNAVNVNSPVTFSWENVTDLDGDTLTHTLYYCTDNTFLDPSCVPAPPPPPPSKTILASLAKGAAGGMAMMFAGVLGIRRRKVAAVLAVLLLATAVVSCGWLDGDSKSTTTPPGTTPPAPPPAQLTEDSGALVANTVYYWKVKVDDGNGGVVESAVWQFTTAL